MPPLFLAGHPALDFLNTAFTPPPGGEPVEAIGDGASFVAWFVEAGLLNAATASKLKRRFGADGLDEVAAEGRKFRQWTIAWLTRWIEAPTADYGAELQRLNRLLERASSYREVVAAEGGFKSVEHGRLDEAGDLVSILASQLARLVTSEDPALVKRCAGSGCILWFVDRTKAHRRMFCSASACGNRAKVAAFRERERASS
ncbi:MAG: CGNR zinc finger domain-containing protein [Polyangiaceae bacterium]